MRGSYKVSWDELDWASSSGTIWGGKKGKIGKNVFILDVPQVDISTQRTAGCEEN